DRPRTCQFRTGTAVPAVKVVPPSSEHWPRLAALFRSSPGSASCWCMWPRVPRGAMWDRPAEQNVADLRAAVASGTAAGLLALAGGEAAGWCSAGPASAYGRLEGAVEPDEWVLACVLVAPG